MRMGPENERNACSNLKDFDWQLSLALSSDKMATLGEHLVNLDLQLDDEKRTSSVSLEMDASELQILIDSLEEAHKEITKAKH